MNLFQFRKARAVVTAALPRLAKAERPHAVWVRDPETGRLVQSWTADEDGERSCMGRPPRPPFFTRLAA
jgi:hypothetical protein